MNWNDEREQGPAVARRTPAPTNFVQPDPAPIVPRRVEILPPAPMPEAMPAQPVKAASLVTGDLSLIHI